MNILMDILVLSVAVNILIAIGIIALIRFHYGERIRQLEGELEYWKMLAKGYARTSDHWVKKTG